MESNSSLRNANKLSFVQTTIAPSDYQVMPPNIHNGSTIVKELTVYGSYSVNDVGLVNPFVSTQQGVLAWNVTRDTQSISRFGRIPAGSVVPSVGFPIIGSNTFTFVQDLWAPYNNADSVAVTPDMSEQFSSSRLFAGVVEVQSSTTSTTSAALSGTLSCGTIMDTRDVWQQAGANSLSATNLVQNSITKKDGLLNVPIHDGLVTIVGSDIPVDFSIPNANDQFRSHGGIATINGATFVPPATTAGSSTIVQQMYWITPWDITLGLGGMQNLQIPNVGIYTEVGFDVVYSFPVNGVYYQTPGALATAADAKLADFDLNIRMVAADAYLRVRTTGAIEVTWSSTVSYDIAHLHDTVTRAAAGTFHHHPQVIVGDQFRTNGMYIGTCFWLTVENMQNLNATAWNLPIPAPTVLTFNVKPLALYDRGELGPVRILRWDGVANGQTVNVTGRLLCEAVPQGAVAPFVTPGALTDSMSMSVNLFPFLSLLYNGKSPFRRNWVRSHYYQVLRDVVPRLTPESLLTWSDMPAEVVHAAEAAGIFEGIGGKLGGMAGGLLDGIVGEVFAGGTYGGSAESAGLYGQAGGIYGHAGGTYGGGYQSDQRGYKRMR